MVRNGYAIAYRRYSKIYLRGEFCKEKQIGIVEREVFEAEKKS